MKIKKEQLEKITEQQEKLNSIITKIGYIEAQKHGLLHELAGVNQDIEEFKKALEEEYGPVNIDLKDGTYTEIKEEQEKEIPIAHV
tara:strand:+ start:298 stop:555 length:258 start_codon:yes stop_codon:yes gene_type:complete